MHEQLHLQYLYWLLNLVDFVQSSRFEPWNRVVRASKDVLLVTNILWLVWMVLFFPLKPSSALSRLFFGKTAQCFRSNLEFSFEFPNCCSNSIFWSVFPNQIPVFVTPFGISKIPFTTNRSHFCCNSSSISFSFFSNCLEMSDSWWEVAEKTFKRIWLHSAQKFQLEFRQKTVTIG